MATTPWLLSVYIIRNSMIYIKFIFWHDGCNLRLCT
jgi:hypothetical protein